MFSAYSDVPGYLLVFPVVYGSILFFTLAMARHLRVFAAAQPSAPFGAVRLRFGGLVLYALGQAKMFKDLRAGIMHIAIFWGFVLLTVGTADISTGGLVQAVVDWPFAGALWTAVVGMQNAVAVVVLVAVAYACWRRLVSRPQRLTYTRGALLILLLIAGVVSSELLATAFESAKSGDRAGAFVANAIAVPLRSLNSGAAETGFVTLWWTHIVFVAAFLWYLPGSKHLHIVTSFINVYFRKLAPRGELPAMDLEREDQTFGVRTFSDLGWKDMLDGFTCTECGRCEDACPAHATGKPLDPKSMIMGIRRVAVEAEAGLPLLPAVWGANGRRRVSADMLAKRVVDNVIPYDAVWDCVTCGACVEACPVLIEHVDKIIGFRRSLVLEDARFPQELHVAFRNMETAGNPWGQAHSARLDWAKGLPFAVPTVAQLARVGTLDAIEVLYWVGCAAAFDDRNTKVARAVVSCLSAAGVRFAVLGPEESCTGDPARRMGNEYLFQLLARGNIETLRKYDVERRTIVTACPHCFNAIGVEYKQLGGAFTVMHHAEYLRRLLASGRLPVVDSDLMVPSADGALRCNSPTASVPSSAVLPSSAGSSVGATASVTLHDSCYLARYNDMVTDPRAILRVLPGVQLREMEQHGRATFCCGAGGGRMWMEETRGTRINAERTHQALATGATTLVTECPFCMTMLRDGLAETGRATDIQISDLAELLAARVPCMQAST